MGLHERAGFRRGIDQFPAEKLLDDPKVGRRITRVVLGCQDLHPLVGFVEFAFFGQGEGGAVGGELGVDPELGEFAFVELGLVVVLGLEGLADGGFVASDDLSLAAPGRTAQDDDKRQEHDQGRQAPQQLFPVASDKPGMEKTKEGRNGPPQGLCEPHDPEDHAVEIEKLGQAEQAGAEPGAGLSQQREGITLVLATAIRG